MSEQTPAEPTDEASPGQTSAHEAAAYDPATDPDSDPDNLNPRDTRESSPESYDDPDGDPANLNPRDSTTS